MTRDTNVHSLPLPAYQDDGFGKVHGALMEEMEALRCVRVVLRQESLDAEELSAASSLLSRTVQRIDKLHMRLDAWHVRLVGPRAARAAAAMGAPSVGEPP